ncbi:hypothetical protein DDP54_06840 [Cellulomonas sp. WB94]|uniref:DUF4190 domain-containing protein n=1 Tax=Cellulomonas sp. WB94 TaxID=2173174 RepID=UPI000D5756F7|nr:DUF4190 domain-containing protein [Cellulomonas sp. WB94]PVU82772.1 hypothetical protein DDP54_06840 [Cellulomonas sp. WB94]
MSTPPTWPLPQPERPNPFAPPAAQPDGSTAGAPSPYGAGYAPPTGYDAAPTPPPSWTPEPVPADAPAPGPSGTGYPQTPGYPPAAPGYPPAPPAYGSPQAGYPQTPGYPPAAPGYGAPQGQGAYGYPQAQSQVPSYGYAQQQGPYGYPQPQWGNPQPPWDGLAIASMSVSGAGIVTMGITGPVGIGLGIASLRKIRRTGARGRGLAWAGIAVGILMTLFIAGFVALVVVGARSGWESETNSSRTSTPLTEQSQEPVEFLAFDERLWPGDCLEVVPSADLLDAAFIDCAAPHAAEVLAYEDFTLAPSSVEQATAVQADCGDIAVSVAGGALMSEVAGSVVWAPSDVDWTNGVRSGYCLLVSSPGGLTGSALDGTLAGESPQVQS